MPPFSSQSPIPTFYRQTLFWYLHQRLFCFSLNFLNMKSYSFSLLCLASFIKSNIFQIHPYCHMYMKLILFYFIFMLICILFYYVLFYFIVRKYNLLSIDFISINISYHFILFVLYCMTIPQFGRLPHNPDLWTGYRKILKSWNVRV